MHLAFVFSHLSVLRKKHLFPFLPSEQRDTPPINFMILIFLSAPQQYKYIITQVSALLRFTEYSGGTKVRTHFPCQKFTLLLGVKQRLQCSE